MKAHRLLGFVVLVLSLGLTSCAHRFATLEGVVRDQVPVPPEQLQELRVERPTKGVVPVSIGMGIKKKDTIEVCDRCTALIKIGKEYQVALAGGSEVEILNPSIDLKKGLAYVRKLVEKTHGFFKVYTRNTVAIVSGTEFLISATPVGDVRITVLEGAVTCESRTNQWPPVVYRALQKGAILGGGPPSPPSRISADAARREVAWVRQADRVTTRTVPTLLDLSESEARREIEDAGFVLGSVGHTITGEHRVGSVAIQHPKAGGASRAGTRMNITLEDPSVDVPDFSGKTLDQGKSLAGGAGLTLAAPKSVESDSPDGQVLSQTPSAGSHVRPGSSVKLTIATTRWCVVPKVLDLPLDQARTVLEKAGLHLGVATNEGGDVNWVNTQDPPAGARVKCGTAVNVRYGRVG